MIKEIITTIQLDEKGDAQWTSPWINGKLKIIIVLPEISVPHIKLNMTAYTPNFIILEEKEITSRRYLAPAVQHSSNDGRFFSQSTTEWILNSPIHFKFSGGFNKLVKIIIKYEV